VTGGNFNLCVLCRDVGAHAPSGLVRATCDLAETLAESGHTVHLLTDRSPGPPPELKAASYEPLTVSLASGPFQGAAVETARHNLLHAAAAYRAVKRLHEHEQPVDAVLAPLWRSEAALCLLDDRFPTVISCMTSLRTLTEVDGSYRQLEDIEERLSLEREALSRSRYLHGLTHAALSKTIGDYQLEPAATAVIGRGIRDRLVAGFPEQPSRPAQILFVGRIERRKGVDTLLAAVADVLEEGVEANLVVAGPVTDPSVSAQLEDEIARRAQLANRVRLTGAVSDAELSRLYAEADIVCIPSRYESHGIVLIEAMMFGKAIVACDGGGVGEVVDAGRNALLSPPENAPALAGSLRRLLSDPGLRTSLGAEARATFERRFDAGVVARQMESFLADVIELHRSADPAPGDSAGRLAELLGQVLGLEPGRAPAAARELLDPAAGEPLRHLTAAARQTRPPARAEATQRIAAVVLTRDRPELLERSLDSLEESETPVDTLVIDNASTPAQSRRVSAVCAGRHRVRLRRSEVNLGTAAGRQLGIELSDSDLVLFLDDDAELLPGALEHLLAELDEHPSVGAVSATVVSSDGLVLHSGGSLDRADGVVTFGLIGSGTEFDPEAVPASGEAGWVPGTAALVRRGLLDEFPIDERMAAYFEDNEWCYRVARARPGSFRRSREALVFHQLMPSTPLDPSWPGIVRRVDLLSAAARFYQRHGALLAPSVFDLLPELRAEDGTYDVGSARTLMELIAARGPEWTAAAWARRDLRTLLEGYSSTRNAYAELRRRQAHLEQTHIELDRAQAELEQLRRAVAAQDETLTFLRVRHEILCMVEEGGWWRLRGRVLPLIRVAGAVRGRLNGRAGAGQRPRA
jgi:glycosyltransferase involved in cell wall biosynthesis/GT2 family glycosyltransferase